MERNTLKTRSAFTLIEIMVASVVMVILVGLVIQITTSVLKVWNDSSGKLSANAEARIALDLLTQDLETAVLKNNSKQWLRVDAPALSGGPYGNQTVALKLFSPALDRDQSQSGDICAIAYHLEYGPAFQGSTDNIYALYRKLETSEDTFDDFMGSSTDIVQDSLTGAGWEKADIVTEGNYLAGNIIDFKVLLYEENIAAGIAEVVNATPNLDIINESFFLGGSAGTSIDNPLLFAEVILTVISDEGLQLLQRFEQVGSFEQYENPDDILRENGQTFTRRVNFLARPL
jgi:prepilin-type N-terminal cleavage/methylation domain-containing protein